MTTGLDQLRFRWLCVYCMHVGLTIVHNPTLPGGYAIPRSTELARIIAQLRGQPAPIVQFELLCWHCGRGGNVGAYSEPEALAIWNAAAWVTREQAVRT